MTRLIHLNGTPGIGKSTIARAWVAGHPGTLNCDVDVLRSMIGGWSEDFVGAGTLIRPAALAMIEAYLAHSGDVVFPQMLLRLDELEKFAAAAHRAAAQFVEVMLVDDRPNVVGRFQRRGGTVDADPWHDEVRAIVAAQGGESFLLECHDSLAELARHRPGTVVVRTVEGQADRTCRAVREALEPRVD